MNVFYAPPEQINGERIELSDHEAHHAAKVLRYREGDPITIVDGVGGWYEGTVQQVLRNSVQVAIERHVRKNPPVPDLMLGLGIIKKRDRMEFAVEKAVELGVSGIALFRSEHTVKENVRLDRLESTVMAAMKQSLRVYLPGIRLFGSSLETLDAYPGYKPLVAHEKRKRDPGIPEEMIKKEKLLLLVGPEGGFSEEEITAMENRGAEIVSLGDHRLRTETAAVALLSQFIG